MHITYDQTNNGSVIGAAMLVTKLTMEGVKDIHTVSIDALDSDFKVDYAVMCRCNSKNYIDTITDIATVTDELDLSQLWFASRNNEVVSLGELCMLERQANYARHCLEKKELFLPQMDEPVTDDEQERYFDRIETCKSILKKRSFKTLIINNHPVRFVIVDSLKEDWDILERYLMLVKANGILVDKNPANQIFRLVGPVDYTREVSEFLKELGVHQFNTPR